MSRSALFCTVTAFFACVIAFLSSCSGGGSNNKAMPATVNISISDPATCSAPKGAFTHVYVTIKDVQIHSSASAGDNDPGWVDLTPNLQQNPQQVDLLSQGDSQCFLASLGSSTQLQPGSYQQIRIFLATDPAAVKNNQCGTTANCLVLTNDTTHTPQPLLLSSQSQTGLKIPSGQIAGGQFVIAAGQTKDLDIDFNACASIIAQGNGQFRLKPVLHAGEVSLTSSSINGRVVDSVTGQPIAGGNTVVALERKDSAGVDRVVMETVTDSSGAFVFCPVAAGTYDVVAVSVNGAQVAYGATVITGVQPGNALGVVPLVAQAGTNKSPASITGQVSSTKGTATAADISISALQAISINSSTVLVTIPLAAQSAATANLTTAASASCPANTDCATYTLSVPAANPAVGSFNTSGNQTPGAPASGAVNYTVDALAFVPSVGTADCNPSNLQTSVTSTNTPLTVVAGTSITASTVAFSGCQ